ncbi:hypothetical protein L6232_20875, partial [Shewanella sp. C31]|nr:hypothetical protein [Shewanella electrica]
ALKTSVRPLAAALAVAARKDPSLIDNSIELVGARGFGDERLDAIAHELVQLRYEAGEAEFDAVVRRLRAKGMSEDAIARLEKDARRAGVSAPFLDETAARERVRDLWQQAFDLLMQLDSLEKAVEAAARDLPRDQDAQALIHLKAERDHLRKLVNS